jgi:hypothetical protein
MNETDTGRRADGTWKLERRIEDRRNVLAYLRQRGEQAALGLIDDDPKHLSMQATRLEESIARMERSLAYLRHGPGTGAEEEE